MDTQENGINKAATGGVFVVAVLLIFFLLNQKPTTLNVSNDQTQPETLSQETSSSDTITPMETVNELKIEDLVVGTGAEAKTGQTITVNYKGTLTNGTQFDSSYDRGTPFTFTLGVGEVIQGWDKGFAGMKVGGKRKLTIPSSMAYGNRDLGTIPPNSTLIFEVELLDLKN